MEVKEVALQRSSPATHQFSALLCCAAIVLCQNARGTPPLTGVADIVYVLVAVLIYDAGLLSSEVSRGKQLDAVEDKVGAQVRACA